VSEALADRRLSSAIWDRTIGLVWGHTIIGMDGDEHRKHRGMISQAFTRRALARWQDDVIEPAVDGLIDRFVERGTADLFAEFTLMFPVYIITELLGLDRDDIPAFHTWAAETISAFHDFDRAIAASRQLEAYLAPVIESRRDSQGEDMISVLANAEL